MEALTEQLTCSLCLELYNHTDKKPKALPCLHTFCAFCLQRFLRDKLKSTHPCPQCRKEFSHHPKNGVESLPTNFGLKALIDALDSITDKSKHQQQANRGYLSTSNGQLLCSKHDKKSCTFICLECIVGMCNTCVLSSDKADNHSEHKRVEAEEYIKNMNKVKHDLKIESKKVADHLKMLNVQKYIKFNQAYESLCQEIETKAREAHAKVDQWKTNTKQQLEATKTKKQKEYNSTLTVLIYTRISEEDIQETDVMRPDKLQQIEIKIDQQKDKADALVNQRLAFNVPPIRVNPPDEITPISNKRPLALEHKDHTVLPLRPKRRRKVIILPN